MARLHLSRPLLRVGNAKRAASSSSSTASLVDVSALRSIASTAPQSAGNGDEGGSGLPRLEGKGPPPEEPPAGLCCMSGCANCVWLEHAKELIAYYEDGGAKAEEALKKIKDPSLKAFLKFELQSLKPKGGGTSKTI